MLAGVGLRVYVLRTRLGYLDADEGVWGLMARRVLHGELPVFFWKQSYGGTAETFLTAPIFWLAGSGTVGVRIVPITLWALAAVLGRLAAAGLLLLALGAFAWRLARRRGRSDEVLLAVCVVLPFLYVASGLTWVVLEPRYLTMLFPVLALLFMRAFVRAAAAGAALGLAAAVGLSAAGLASARSSPNLTMPAPTVPAPARLYTARPARSGSRVGVRRRRTRRAAACGGARRARLPADRVGWFRRLHAAAIPE